MNSPSALADYICPLCLGVRGIENEHTLLRQDDLIYKDALVSVFINSFWIPTCEGHVIVLPNEHFENLYTLPVATNHRIAEVVQLMAITIRQTYQCDGITTRQNNEPAADQHALHYHHHVFPRYHGDTFNESLTKKGMLSDPSARLSYAKKLRIALSL